ncbi:hypothetical protein BDN70DRAFT_943787 [Pholiota conissans]|uniref:Uncharacterized protein n=1 Tax=Pholiota conissans TaxID=109636 RepID=A0A9P5ZDA8_9AGAR|nr:hypothetical protein BDN70DRAFT_943787 [Pholiota conissans]
MKVKDLEPPVIAITHSKLQSLEIHPHLCDAVFEKLTCPSLKTLKIADSYSRFGLKKTAGLADLAVHFLKKSECSLENLIIVDDVSGSGAASICRELPTLEHLSLRLHSPTPNSSSLYERLSQYAVADGKNEFVYLPALRSLAIKHRDIPRGIWRMLPRILNVKARERDRQALQSVSLDALSSKLSGYDMIKQMGKEAVEDILWLKEAGVEWKIQGFIFDDDACQPSEITDLVEAGRVFYGIPST